MSTITKSQAQTPLYVILSTTGQIGYQFKVEQAGKIIVSLPGQNPNLIDADAIVRSCSPIEQRDLISITRGISSNADGVAHAANELRGKRVLLTANGKSRVGVINRVEKTDDDHKIFLAIEGSVAVISASEVRELEERPQDFYISVDVIEAGTFVFWLKDFVRVDVHYTIAAKRLRISAAVSSVIDPQICFSAQQVKITHQDLAAVDESDNLQAYAVDCDAVTLSPDQTLFNLFSAALTSVESLISLKYTALIYKSGDSKPQGIQFDKATSFALELKDTEKEIVRRLLGRASFAGNSYSVCEISLPTPHLLMITVDSETLVYSSFDWSRDTSEIQVPELRKFDDSARIELITYTNSSNKLFIRANRLGLVAGQTVLVIGLPDTFTKVGLNGNEASSENSAFRFTVVGPESSIVFSEEVSQRDNGAKHWRYELYDESGSVNYFALNFLPEIIFPAAHKPALLQYKQSWAAYLQKVESVTISLQKLLKSRSDQPNYLALVRFVTDGKADLLVDATEDLVEPAKTLLAAVRVIVSDDLNR